MAASGEIQWPPMGRFPWPPSRHFEYQAEWGGTERFWESDTRATQHTRRSRR
jgi:hypothetical protein